MLKELKAFILRGNVIDIAVGLAIAGAFNNVTASFTRDILTPPLGVLLGRVDLKHMAVKIWTAKDGSPVLLSYGAFISTVVDFLLIGIALFLVVKAVNKLQALRKKEDAPPPAPATKPCTYCLMDVPAKATRCGHCTSAI
jgi:large conductance mechanosensitive channel